MVVVGDEVDTKAEIVRHCPAHPLDAEAVAAVLAGGADDDVFGFPARQDAGHQDGQPILGPRRAAGHAVALARLNGPEVLDEDLQTVRVEAENLAEERRDLDRRDAFPAGLGCGLSALVPVHARTRFWVCIACSGVYRACNG